MKITGEKLAEWGVMAVIVAVMGGLVSYFGTIWRTPEDTKNLKSATAELQTASKDFKDTVAQMKIDYAIMRGDVDRLKGDVSSLQVSRDATQVQIYSQNADVLSRISNLQANLALLMGKFDVEPIPANHARIDFDPFWFARATEP